MKQKQITQAIPERRVKKTGTQGGVTVTVDVGHKSAFDPSVTSNIDRMVSTYKENTIVDYSDAHFDWSFIGQNIETILEETTKQSGDRLAETTIVIADIEVDVGSSIGFNTVFAITTAVMNAVAEI